MKLFGAVVVSLVIHLAMAYFYTTWQSAPKNNLSLVGTEVVYFDLGLMLGEVESKIVKQVNSKRNQASTQQEEVKTQKTEVQKVAKLSQTKPMPKPVDTIKPVETIKPLVNKELKVVKPSVVEPKKEVLEKVKPIKKTVEHKLVEKKPSDPVTKSLARDINQQEQMASVQSIEKKVESSDTVSSGGKAALTQSERSNAASYITGLQAAIARQAYRYYPSKAKRRHQEGVVMVSFKLTKTGELQQMKIVKASEYVTLDNAALRALKRVGRYKPRPAGVSDRFVIPIHFSIQ